MFKKSLYKDKKQKKKILKPLQLFIKSITKKCKKKKLSKKKVLCLQKLRQLFICVIKQA